MTALQRGRNQQVGARGLPAFNYYLDDSDPDVLVLRRQGGSFVATFSATGATREGIVEAAREDYQELIRAWTGSPGLQESGERERSA